MVWPVRAEELAELRQLRRADDAQVVLVDRLDDLDLFLVSTFRGTPTANAEGWIEPEGGADKRARVGSVVRRPRTDNGTLL